MAHKCVIFRRQPVAGYHSLVRFQFIASVLFLCGLLLLLLFPNSCLVFQCVIHSNVSLNTETKFPYINSCSKQSCFVSQSQIVFPAVPYIVCFPWAVWCKSIMSGAIPLLPLCLHGMDKYNFTFSLQISSKNRNTIEPYKNCFLILLQYQLCVFI